VGLFFFLLFFLFFLPLSLLLFSLWTTHGDTHVDKAHAYTARAAGTFSLSSFLSLSRSLSLSLSLSLSHTHTHTHTATDNSAMMLLSHRMNITRYALDAISNVLLLSSAGESNLT
jgi:hypothetical protein